MARSRGPLPDAEAAAHPGELHEAETLEEVLEGKVLAERDEMDLVVAADDAALIVDDEQAVIDVGGAKLVLRVSLLDEPSRAHEQRGSLRQRGADGEKRVGRIGEEKGHRRLGPDHDVDAVEAARLGEIEILGEDLGAVLGAPFLGLVDIGLDDAHAEACAGLLGRGEPVLAPHIAKPEQKHEKGGECRRPFASTEAGARRREDGGRARKQEHGQEAQGIDPEKGRQLHQREVGEKPIADEIPGKPGQHMAAGELGEAERDGQGEDPARSRQPEQHGQSTGRGEEERHASRHRGHDKRQKPAVAPGLDQESLGNPVEPGQEIAETEPESDESGAFQPVRQAFVLRLAAVKQPDQRAEGEEQYRPGMDRRKGEHRERTEKHGKDGAAGASQARDPSGGAFSQRQRTETAHAVTLS